MNISVLLYWFLFIHIHVFLYLHIALYLHLHVLILMSLYIYFYILSNNPWHSFRSGTIKLTFLFASLQTMSRLIGHTHRRSVYSSWSSVFPWIGSRHTLFSFPLLLVCCRSPSQQTFKPCNNVCWSCSSDKTISVMTFS